MSLVNSYTIESSCYGYAIKTKYQSGPDYEEEEAPVVVQFTHQHFLAFGKTLAVAVGKHLNVAVNDLDRCGKCYGLTLDLEFGLMLEAPSGLSTKPALTETYSRANSIDRDANTNFKTEMSGESERL